MSRKQDPTRRVRPPQELLDLVRLDVEAFVPFEQLAIEPVDPAIHDRATAPAPFWIERVRSAYSRPTPIASLPSVDRPTFRPSRLRRPRPLGVRVAIALSLTALAYFLAGSACSSSESSISRRSPSADPGVLPGSPGPS